MPPTNAIASVSTNAGQYAEPPLHQLPGDVGRERRDRALREVDHLGRAVDQDERDREAGVDAAVRETGDGQLGEQRAVERPDDRRREAARTAARAARWTIRDR